MIAGLKKNTETKMQKSVENLKANLAKVRTGRAHTGLLDHISVEYYGCPTLISQLASVSLLDARTLSVSPFEKKMGAAIEKAIRDSDLGLNPSSMGDIVRVPMPALTEERRRDLIKVVRGESEDSRVAVRNLRRDGNEQLKKAVKDKLISEDEERRGTDDMQKLTDKYIAEIDKMLAEKEKELLTV